MSGGEALHLLTLDTFYALGGLVLLAVAVRVARHPSHPRRWTSALFWGLLALLFLFGKQLPPRLVGYGVLALVLLAATRRVVPSLSPAVDREERKRRADRLGNRVFLPALLIPLTAVLGAVGLRHAHLGQVWLMEGRQATLISLGLGTVIAWLVAWRLTRAPAKVPLAEGSRLLEAIGWALLLPQLLAALGGVFATAGVGEVVAGLVAAGLPTHLPWVAVVAYCLGMALFTLVLGNAFAAFAVVTGGIGLPLVVHQHGGNPAIMAALGMLSGYCGTLMTPMAANFNLVPAMLLELKDPHAVIRAQIPAGLVILAANILILYFCVYRF